MCEPRRVATAVWPVSTPRQTRELSRSYCQRRVSDEGERSDLRRCVERDVGFPLEQGYRGNSRQWQEGGGGTQRGFWLRVSPRAPAAVGFRRTPRHARPV